MTFVDENAKRRNSIKFPSPTQSLFKFLKVKPSFVTITITRSEVNPTERIQKSFIKIFSSFLFAVHATNKTFFHPSSLLSFPIRFFHCYKNIEIHLSLSSFSLLWVEIRAGKLLSQFQLLNDTYTRKIWFFIIMQVWWRPRKIVCQKKNEASQPQSSLAIFRDLFYFFHHISINKFYANCVLNPHPEKTEKNINRLSSSAVAISSLWASSSVFWATWL